MAKRVVKKDSAVLDGLFGSKKRSNDYLKRYGISVGKKKKGKWAAGSRSGKTPPRTGNKGW